MSQSSSHRKLSKSKVEMDIINEVFETLNEKAREAIVLYRFKGYTYYEIASEMGISTRMAKKHISNALMTFGKKFRQHTNGFVP